eukprot:jgi/Chlat1/5485/Chrsp36S00422
METGDQRGGQGGEAGYAARDTRAGLLIPLNNCRRETFDAPWQSKELRHSYKKCEYNAFMQRIKTVDTHPSLRDTQLAQELAD